MTYREKTTLMLLAELIYLGEMIHRTPVNELAEHWKKINNIQYEIMTRTGEI